MSARLSARFDALSAADRAAFIPYVMGGDPDLETSWALLDGLVRAGADIVELGFPFTDPTADGPSIAAAGRRALDAGTTLDAVLALAQRFRGAHPATPLILMGYANPLHARGWAAFADAAAAAGVDGCIIVDLPPEEDPGLNTALAARDIALVRLAAPTSDAARLPKVVENARGMVYAVSIAGVTGAAAATDEAVAALLARIRSHTSLPVAVGFGVRTPEQAAVIARRADAVVVGSALVEAAAREGVHAALDAAAALAQAVRTARTDARASAQS